MYTIGYQSPNIPIHYRYHSYEYNKNRCDMMNTSEYGKVLHKFQISKLNTEIPPIRLLCIIYSISKEYSTKIDAIFSTWGKRCSGIVVYSNTDDSYYNAIHLYHEGPEIYENIWQKVRSIWKHVASNYISQYDYFFICGDDTFVLVENMLLFLK